MHKTKVVQNLNNFLLPVMESVHGLPHSGAPPASQDSNIRPSESGVAQGVQDRVNSGIYVAEIVRKLPQYVRNILFSCGLAQYSVDDD